MKRNFLKVVFLLLTILIVTGCGEKTENPMTWTKPSEGQIQEFLNKKGASLVAIRSTQQTSIILYETNDEKGYYDLSVDNKGQIQILSASSTRDSGEPSPVADECFSLSRQSPLPDVSFATVIINDKTLLKNAYKLNVKFNNGFEVTELVNQKKGFIVMNDQPNNSESKVESVILLSKDGKVLFRAKK